MDFQLPYYKGTLPLHVPDKNLKHVLVNHAEEFHSDRSEADIVRDALAAPIGTPPLSALAQGKQNILVITSDHTRSMPSGITMPILLEEIRKGQPDASITILIATGLHRPTTQEELLDRFGPDIVARERIVVHNTFQPEEMRYVCQLPSGAGLSVNRLALESDLIVSEGFIEPHFFAGFSGSRKSILPGVASRTTVLANHCSEFIASPYSRTGILEGNPIHRDMVWAARKAGLAFICNVVINSEKEPIYAVAGDAEKAHEEGCRFLSSLCRVKAKKADIVISTNGGYPLDQNIYQAVKGMTAAEATVNEGGVIIMLAASNDGLGGDDFYHQMADEKDIHKTMALFLSRGRNETVPDQWQTQIFLRILMKATVVYVSSAPDEIVEDLHMIPAHSLEEALEKARKIIGRADATITAIPDGVSVIVE